MENEKIRSEKTNEEVTEIKEVEVVVADTVAEEADAPQEEIVDTGAEEASENGRSEIPPSALPNKKEPLSSRNWFVIMMLFMFFPVGLYLMWSKKKWTKNVRIVVTVIVAIAVLVNIGTSPDSSTKDSEKKADTEVEEEQAVETEAPAEEVPFDIDSCQEVSYDSLARNPDDYKGTNVKLSGRVIQVVEGTDSVTIRLAVSDDYDTVIMGSYSSSIVSSRILKDDYITVYGTAAGIYTYESSGAGSISVPLVFVESISMG